MEMASLAAAGTPLVLLEVANMKLALSCMQHQILQWPDPTLHCIDRTTCHDRHCATVDLQCLSVDLHCASSD